jgi:hypothetical protein
MQGLLAQTLLAATLQARASLHPRRISVEHLLATWPAKRLPSVGSTSGIRGTSAGGRRRRNGPGLGLNNLLQNAVKFTRTGGRVQLKAHATSDGVVCIQVEDECGGLPGATPKICSNPSIAVTTDAAPGSGWRSRAKR